MTRGAISAALLIALAGCQAGTLSGKLAVRAGPSASSDGGPAIDGALPSSSDASMLPVADAGASADPDATPGAPDAPAGAPDATPPSDAGPVVHPDAEPPPPCSMPLAIRIHSVEVTTSAPIGSGGGNQWTDPNAVHLAPTPSGGYRAAWIDQGSTIHITPLDGDGVPNGAEWTVPGSEIRGLVAHDDGAAVLVVRGDAMRLVRVGAGAFDLLLVGENSHDMAGQRWIDGWGHQGRLAWSGTEYAAYFGQTGDFGSMGHHQGDHLVTVSPSGALSGGGWDWGCSHSLDLRLAHNGARFGPVCLSDCYPEKAVLIDHYTKLHDEPSGDCAGGSSAALAGVAPISGGFWVSFISREGRASSDVALQKVLDSGMSGSPIWLTDTPGVEERGGHLAPYGGGLLAGWEAGGTTTLVALDAQGTVVEGPIASPAPFGLDDFVPLPGGDVVWAAIDGSNSFSLVRARACR